MMRWRTAVVVLCIVPLVWGCDQGDRAERARGMPLESAGRRLVQLRTLTQLQPNRKTHLAVDRLGQIFWVQESEESAGAAAQDVLFMIGDGGIPRTTRLTTSNILQAIEEAADSAGAGANAGGRTAGNAATGATSGRIRAITAAEGGVYFFFYGYRGNSPRACIGQYMPQSARIRILADTAALEKASGMGRSMDLARVSMVTTDQTVYVWLRHSDTSAFFSFEPRALGPAGGAIELRPPFTQILQEARPLPLTRLDAELAPAPGSAFFLLDLTSGLLWEVNRVGEADARLSLIGLPKGISPPTATADGRLLMFAPDTEKIGTELEVLSRQDLPAMQFPAVLEVRNTEITPLPRDDFRAHAGFPVYTLHFGRLIPERPGSFVSYDSTSGALMRVTITERD